jgi:hypothetical protein
MKMSVKYRIVIGLLLFSGVMAMTVKYVQLLAEGPQSELLLEEKNERYDLKLYGEKTLAVVTTKASARGPQMLQSKGDLNKLMKDLNPDYTVLNETSDQKIYKVDIRFHVPKEEVMGEINQLLMQTLGYQVIAEHLEKEVYVMHVADAQKAQSNIKDNLPEGAEGFTQQANNQWQFYGYTLDQTLDKINEARKEQLFYGEGPFETRIGIKLSNIRNKESVIQELLDQGIGISKTTRGIPTLRISR